MKVTRYFIDEKAEETPCVVCGKKIKLDEVSYELRFEKNRITKEEMETIWCKDCLPEDAKVFKGTQLHNCTEYRKNLKKGIR